MVNLIDKSAVVAEIEKKRDAALTRQRNLEAIGQVTVLNELIANELNRIITFINTLEVKEVDLEKELENLIEKEKAFVTDNREVKYYNGDSFNHIYELEFIARHFFELGLKQHE